MTNVENIILQIKDNKAGVEEIKNSNHPEEGKDREQLQNSEKIPEEKEVTVPTEYFAINLLNLI